MKWILFLITFSAMAQNTVQINTDDFSFNHPTCLLRFNSKQEFSTNLKENLTTKGFKLHDFIEKDKLNPEDMYVQLTIKREGILFKDCKLNLKINEAGGSKVLSTDKTLLESNVTRIYPRVTFDGDERCRRGIDDLFVDIPKCTSGKMLQTTK